MLSSFTRRTADIVKNNIARARRPPPPCVSSLRLVVGADCSNWPLYVLISIQAWCFSCPSLSCPAMSCPAFSAPPIYNTCSTQYCSTETVFINIPIFHTNITSQMWPSGGKRGEGVTVDRHHHHHNVFSSAPSTLTASGP